MNAEHGVVAALSLRQPPPRYPGKAAEQALANFASTPSWGVPVFHVQGVVFHLERKLIRVSIGPPTSVRQTLNTALLITIEDLVAGFAGDAELPAESAMGSPASRRATNCILSSITEHSFQGITPSPPKRRKCNLCVRYDVLPMSQAGGRWTLIRPKAHFFVP
jgi:hypothetical protein